MGALVNGDVPPYLLVASDDYGRPRGINSEGLKRRGFDGDRIAAIKRAYRAVYVADGSLADARQKLAGMASASADVRDFLDFIARGERPLARCAPGFGIRDWGFAKAGLDVGFGRSEERCVGEECFETCEYRW